MSSSFLGAQYVLPSVLPFECSVTNMEKLFLLKQLKCSLLKHLYDTERAGYLWICKLLPEWHYAQHSKGTLSTSSVCINGKNKS